MLCLVLRCAMLYCCQLVQLVKLPQLTRGTSADTRPVCGSLNRRASVIGYWYAVDCASDTYTMPSNLYTMTVRVASSIGFAVLPTGISCALNLRSTHPAAHKNQQCTGARLLFSGRQQ